jgi:hypothetical protein
MYTVWTEDERPIVGKFAFFKDKMVKSLGERLASTKIGTNDPYQKEIAE